MSMPRYAARRDNNESELIKLAEQLGWWMIPLAEPWDWVGWRRGQWLPIEIKNPDCEGHADEFTAKQRMHHTEAFKRGAKILIWRTADDVIRDSQARASA